MKNQLDLIVIGVSLVLAALIAFIWFETKRTVPKHTPPAQVNTGPLPQPDVAVVFSNSLPGGGGGGGSAMGGMGRGGGMGGGGFGGGGGGEGGGKKPPRKTD